MIDVLIFNIACIFWAGEFKTEWWDILYIHVEYFKVDLNVRYNYTPPCE